ncbi:MAG: hypothetical protein ABFS30_04430 [Pseudomonadota bacterium]
MAILRNLSLAFAAGCAGVVVFYIILAILGQAGVAPKPPFPAFYYKQTVWGGIWALAFVLPILNKQWWLRGIILGVLASLAAVFIFAPALLDAPARRLIMVFVLNAIWGVAAAAWYHKVLKQ